MKTDAEIQDDNNLNKKHKQAKFGQIRGSNLTENEHKLDKIKSEKTSAKDQPKEESTNEKVTKHRSVSTDAII